MLVLRLKKYVPIDGIDQIATTWQVSKDKQFTTLIVNEKTDTRINLATYDLTVPVNEVWYGRAIRHFTNVNNDYTTEARETVNTDDVNSTILLNGDIVVDTPTVYVEVNDILATTESFTIRSSDYRGNDDHVSTTWIIRDGNDDILYYNKFTNENLLAVTVSNNIKYREKSVLKISCIHTSSLGVESPVGTTILELTKYNYEITTNLLQVVPLKDLKIVFKPIMTDYAHNVESIVVRDGGTETVYFTGNMADGQSSITIPWYVLNPNAILFMEIYARDMVGDLTFTSKFIMVQEGKNIEIANPEFVYNKEIGVKAYAPDLYIPNGVVTEETSDNTILVPIYNDNQLHRLKLNTSTGYYEDKGAVSALSLLTTNVDNTYVKTMTGGNIFIDTTTMTGNAIFLHYNYNKATGLAELLSSKVRNDETIPVGKTNAIVWTSDITFIYIPYGLNTLKQYNVVTKALTNLGTIPLPDLTSAIMFRIPGNRVLIIGGSDFTNIIYDIEDKEFREGISTHPGTFINRDLKTVKLVNGDVLIFKTSYDALDTENSLLYFEYETCLFSIINYRFEDQKVPTSSINLLDGKVILDRYNFKEFWQDKTNELVSLCFN